jgi:hypothetical protein
MPVTEDSLDPLDQIGNTIDDWFDYLDYIYRGYSEGQDSDDIDRIYRQQEAQAFREILNGLQDGTATWRDLAAFEYDFLADIPEFVDYYDAITEKSQFDGFFDELNSAIESGDPDAAQSLIDEYVNSGLKDNYYITSTGPVAPPRPAGLPDLTGDFQTQMIKAICQGSPVCAGVDICFEQGQTDCIDPTSINDLWEDVVSHVYIVFGDLGIDIPEELMVLGGLIKLPTLGNIWEKIQTTVGDIANSEDNCRDNVPAGENPDEYCSTSSRITRAIQEGSQDVITKAGEILDGVFETVVEGIEDPAEAAGKIWDWIKGGYGDDPSKAPPWIWEIIVASEVYGQPDVQDALEDIIGTDINDDGSIGTTEPLPYGPDNPNPDCTAQGLETAEDGTCVPSTPEFGYCEDGVTEKADAEGTNCSEYAPNGLCEDGVTKKDNPEGTNCEEYEPPVNPEEQQCDEQGRVFNDMTGECEETCANPEHVVGADGNCGPPEEEQTCDNGATNYPDCNECSNGQQFDQATQQCIDIPVEGCEAVDCSSPRPSSSTFEGQAAYRKWNDCCGETHCPDGSLQQEGFDCAGNPTGPQVGDPCDSNGDGQLDGEIDETGACIATGDPEPEEECAKPDGTPTGATVSSGCEQCPDGYTFDFDGICQPDGGSIDCAQYNRETLDDGTCGGCLPGFQKDTSLPNEPCVAIFDGCPAGYELVNGECLPVTCPEGQSYCKDTGQCEPEGTCPSDEQEDNGSSSSGGGGGGGFGVDLTQPGINANPLLLGRSRFGAQDFLSPLFTGRTGQGTDFPIARFLQGQRKKDDFS